MPIKLREELANDPYYKHCARKNDGSCLGRITWEHAIIFKGRQLQKKFAIIPLCVFHHLGNGLVKEKNIYIALNRASDEELREISIGRDYLLLHKYLNRKYGNM